MSTLLEVFKTMDYGPAPESTAEALDWIASHDGRFGHYIGGAFTKPGRGFESRNPATGAALAKVSIGTAKDVDAAVAAAKAEFLHERLGRTFEMILQRLLDTLGVIRMDALGPEVVTG